MSALFVLKNASRIGGMQSVNKNLVGLLSSRSMKIEMFSFRDSAPLGSPLLGCILDLFKLIYSHISNSYSIYVYNISGSEVIFYSLVTWLFRRRVIFWEHGDPTHLEQSWSYRILQRYFYRYAYAIVILHEKFKRTGNGNSNISYFAIPNPLPIFSKASNIGINPCKGQAKKVVWVGRISPEKQPFIAYNALKLSAKANPDCFFYFIHVPYSPNEYHTEGLTNLCIQDGSEYDFASTLDSDTIFLLTSAKEAMPVVLFEAILSSCRIVTTDCSPWVATINEHYSLIVVEPNVTADTLSMAISTCINNRHQNNKPDSLHSLLNMLSADAVCDKWNELLN